MERLNKSGDSTTYVHTYVRTGDGIYFASEIKSVGGAAGTIPVCGCLGFVCSAGASRVTFLVVLRGDLGPADAPRGNSVSGDAPGGRNDSLVPCKKDLMHVPPPYPLYNGFLGGWGNACAGHCYIFIFLNLGDIPPGGKMKQTLWKNTENSWEIHFPMRGLWQYIPPWGHIVVQGQ